MKIYTKTGDSGETSLFGGKRVAKDDLRIQAYGTVDEVNSALGLAYTEVKSEEVKQIIKQIQNELFITGSDLATDLNNKNSSLHISRINENHSTRLEKYIDELDSKLPQLTNFILPGGLKGAALLHHARTICRRAERQIVSLSKNEKINPQVIIYINRLSDLLFVLARYENHINGVEDILWNK
jgi:cob(I)alamin adenosyltransferase